MKKYIFYIYTNIYVKKVRMYFSLLKGRVFGSCQQLWFQFVGKALDATHRPLQSSNEITSVPALQQKENKKKRRRNISKFSQAVDS